MKVATTICLIAAIGFLSPFVASGSEGVDYIPNEDSQQERKYRECCSAVLPKSWYESMNSCGSQGGSEGDIF